MAYSPQPFPSFGNGLNLRDKADAVDPADAIDALNVEFTERGSVKQRGGYAPFNAVQISTPGSLAPFYKTDGTAHLLMGAGPTLTALDTDGTVVDSESGLTDGIWDFARFGGPGTEVAYAGNGLEELVKYDGSTWAQVTDAPKAGSLAVMAVDQGNRLVAGRFLTTTGGPEGDTSNPSRVWFSDPGDPETFDANNYVDFTPGDGEAVQAVVTWREFVFVFKESKFFRIDGSTEDASGNPIFLWTTFDTGVGLASPRAVVATEYGVFFLDRRGVYLTTGGDPACVSDAVEPVFLGDPSPYYTGGILNQSDIDDCAMGYWDNKVFLGFPTQAGDQRTLVFEPNAGWWSLYDLPATCLASFRVDGPDELMFGDGSNVQRHNNTLTSDNDDAIVSHWRSGWFDYGIPEQKTIRESKVWGFGTLELSIAVDFNTDRGDSSTVDLTEPPATEWDDSTWGGGEWSIDRPVNPALSRRAVRGTVFSTYLYHDVKDQRFALQRLDHHLREQRTESKVTP